jgi:hypothetical protein
MTPVVVTSAATAVLGSGTTTPVILRRALFLVILRSGATKDLLRQRWMGRSRSFAALRMTGGVRGA